MLAACFLIGFLLAFAKELDILPSIGKVAVWVGVLLALLVGAIPLLAITAGMLMTPDGVPSGASVGVLFSGALIAYVIGLILPPLGRMVWEKITAK